MNWLQQLGEWLSRLRFWFTVRPWESGIDVRCGRWIYDLQPGVHLCIPFFDEVFVQNMRLRVLNLPVQTVTNRSGDTVTLSAIVRWRIANVRLIYEQLHNPEDWIYNAVLSAIATTVHEMTTAVDVASIGQAATAALKDAHQVGIEIQGISITDIARVKTFRLITGEGNAGWSWNRIGPLETTHRPQ